MVPESDLWCLAGSCGVDVGELLPNRAALQVGSDLSSLTVGNSIRHLRASQERDGMLREYLSMIYELRNLPPGSRVPLREPDLATLADALGGTPDAIEARLHELIGASREEAARLRAMILPPLALPATTAPSEAYAAFGAPEAAEVTALPTPEMDRADAAEQFFSMPRAEDPWGEPLDNSSFSDPRHVDGWAGTPEDDSFRLEAALMPETDAEPETDAMADARQRRVRWGVRRRRALHALRVRTARGIPDRAGAGSRAVREPPQRDRRRRAVRARALRDREPLRLAPDRPRRPHRRTRHRRGDGRRRRARDQRDRRDRRRRDRRRPR